MVRWAWMCAFALLPQVGGLSAQEVPDSIQQEIQDRLTRMGRQLGDSSGLAAFDSLQAQPGGAGLPAATRSRGPRGDSTSQALMALPGYDVTQYQGAAADFETDTRVLTLTGAEGTQAVLNRDGIQLAADSALIFDERSGRLVTVGAEAIYTPEEGEAVTTERIIFDLDEDRGTATGAQTNVAQGTGSWIVRGDFPWVNPEVSYGHDVEFTSCDLEHAHYHFRAGELKMVPGGTMVAKNVKLYFADVPVFWLPFVAQSTDTGRRSGLLPMRFSVNDIVRNSTNYSRRVSNLGYYWAMSDYTDAEVALDWWSGNYVALTGGFRYRWLRQFLDGRLNFRRFWRDEGGSEFALDTSHNWDVSERTQLRVSAGFVTSADFVRQNSFDPREVTQSIDSDAGLNHRFGWGTLSATANRRQFLSDDRVELEFPRLSLSMSTITLFPAPTNRASFFNNMTLSASGRYSQSLSDRMDQDLTLQSFDLGLADRQTRRAGVSTTLSLGNLSIGQNVDLNRNTTRDVPVDFFDPEDPLPFGVGSVGDLQRSVVFQQQAGEGFRDFGDEELTWSTSINYQQSLIGSTSITPRLSLSGRSIRSDSSFVAGDQFIAAPKRVSFGAQLKTDVYGFWGGFGNFERIRHKFSPTFDYAFTPETMPTQLQTDVFGSAAINPRNELRIGLTQTFEAAVREDDEDEQQAQPDSVPTAGGPTRPEVSPKVTLLAIRTSAVTYDFEQASELGNFNRGFADNLVLSNQISSDFLRGLSISMTHDLFDDSDLLPDGTGVRRFDPHLSGMNLSFSLSNQSGLFRWLSNLAGRDIPEGQEDVENLEDLETADLGESTIVPGFGDARDRAQQQQQAASPGRVGTW
ncbi:MAG: putative LPS assembly protein LptD, partial [Longimicrobiales bacterium]